MTTKEELLRQKEEAKKRLDDFISEKCFFAFSNDQFIEGLKHLGFESVEDCKNQGKKIVSFYGGGFTLKENKEKLFELLDLVAKTKRAYTHSTPENLVKAIASGLNNHEYSYCASDEAFYCGLEEAKIEEQDLQNDNVINAINQARRKMGYECDLSKERIIEKYKYGYNYMRY